MAILQKALRLENKQLAAQLHRDELRRYNAGGRLHDAYFRRVIDRAREDSNVKREIDIKEIFDPSIAKEVDEELTKAKWVP